MIRTKHLYTSLKIQSLFLLALTTGFIVLSMPMA